MFGAAGSLESYGLTVDALENRQFADAVDFLPLAVAELHPAVVVIHLGTNGTIDAHDLNFVMTALGDVPTVVVLTDYIQRPWQATNNDLLEVLPASHPNVVVLDWAALAPACPGDCCATDGFHLTPDGADFYASLIAHVLATQLAIDALADEHP